MKISEIKKDDTVYHNGKPVKVLAISSWPGFIVVSDGRRHYRVHIAMLKKNP